uniref:Uncharacterized protein n=1 Tax=Schistocephalus solidus TaxID=70667 RepID=A0A0X3PC46_SCHSO
MTQIGYESKEFGNQVDKVMLRTLGTEPNDYICPENTKLQRFAPNDSQYVNCGSQCRLPDAKFRTAVQQVNSCTQHGFVRRDQACSPTRDPSGDCPLCHQPTRSAHGRIRRYAEEGHYDTVDAIYSGTEMQAMSEFYQISEEPSIHASDVLVCKRIQAGYPSLNPKGNLYTQVDVYKNAEDVEVGESVVRGDTMRMQALHKPSMNSYAQITVRPIYDSSGAITQVGVIQSNRACSPHRQLSPTRIASESYALEQANMLSADVEELATQPGKRTIRAQAGYPTLTNQRSASTMIFRNSMEPIPELAETSTQNGPIVTATFVQTTEPILYASSERDKGMVSKRTQMGYPRFGPLCDSFAQIGSIYSQSEIQTSPSYQPLIHPESQPLVKAALPDDGPLYAEAGAMARTASVPDLQVSSTQVGTMVTHERLSPIITEISAESRRTQVGQPCTQPKMHSWLQCSVITSDKSALTDAVVSHTEFNVQSIPEPKVEMVNKKFQTMMHAFDSEIQVGRLYSSNAAQTIEVHAEQEAVVRQTATMECQAVGNVESVKIEEIAEEGQHAAMRELPEVASTEAQAAPIYHGKKLQVSVQPALCEMAAEPAKGHNKKVQVSIELRREQFDVSCDAVVKPDTFSKKIQVEDLEPPVLMPTQQEPVFAPAPNPAPSTQEASCECKPILQESSCLAKQAPHIYDASVQITPIPPPLEKTHGKKLQVDLIVSPEPTPMVSKLLQTDPPSLQESAADPCPGKQLFDASVQISTPEPVVVAEPSSVVHAAPPAPTVEYSDTGCDAVSKLEQSDAFSQADPVPEVKAPMIGKKLQVSLTHLRIDGCQTGVMQGVEMAVQSEPVPVSGKKLQVSVIQKVEGVESWAQTTLADQSSMGVQIDAPEPMLMPEPVALVRSAPPQPLNETEDRACDAIQKASGYDAFAQVEPEPKAASVGKKLQVKPPPLDTSTCQTDMVVEPQKSKLAFTGTQCKMPKPSNVGIQIEALEKPMEPVTPQPIALVHSAPPAPVVETEDAACDPVQKALGYDVFTQAEPVPVEKPPHFGKKLQVIPKAPEVASCQTAVTRTEMIDDGVQHVEKVPYEIVGTQCVPPPKAETFGKKLQVRLSALDTSSCQTELIPKVDKPVLGTAGAQCPKVNLASLGIQIEMLEPVPEIVPLQPTQVVHAAAPVAETEDRACDAIGKKDVNDAYVQVEHPNMVQASVQLETAPKPQVFGKKLQVKILNLDNKDSQTDAEKNTQACECFFTRRASRKFRAFGRGSCS